MIDDSIGRLIREAVAETIKEELPPRIEAVRAQARRDALEEAARLVEEAVRGEGGLWAQPVADPRGDRDPDCSDVLDRLPAAIRQLKGLVAPSGEGEDR